MLFNNLAFFARFGFFQTWFDCFSKVSGNPAAANILTPKGKNCSTVSDVNDRFARVVNGPNFEARFKPESQFYRGS